MKIDLIAIFFLFWFLPSLNFADNFEKVENRVFKTNRGEYLRTLETNGNNKLSLFQNALLHYRIGNMTGNKTELLKSIQLFETLSKTETNVYVLSYLAMSVMSQARFGKGIIGANLSSKKAMALLNRAVKLYPDHYLPRFSRGMMLLFMHGIMGGNEKQGQKDMEMVIRQIPSVHKDRNYKAFIYFIYGVYWGEKKKQYQKALDYIVRSEKYASNPKLIESILKKSRTYSLKLKKLPK